MPVIKLHVVHISGDTRNSLILNHPLTCSDGLSRPLVLDW